MAAPHRSGVEVGDLPSGCAAGNAPLEWRAPTKAIGECLPREVEGGTKRRQGGATTSTAVDAAAESAPPSAVLATEPLPAISASSTCLTDNAMNPEGEGAPRGRMGDAATSTIVEAVAGPARPSVTVAAKSLPAISATTSVTTSGERSVEAGDASLDNIGVAVPSRPAAIAPHARGVPHPTLPVRPMLWGFLPFAPFPQHAEVGPPTANGVDEATLERLLSGKK
jgi:hypothetical protein